MLLPGGWGGFARAQEVGGPARGANIYFATHDAADPAAIDLMFADLRSLNIDTVLITYPIYIDSIFGNDIGPKSTGDDLHPYAQSPTFADLQVLIDRANASGIAVWLRPLLDEEILGREMAGGWRGNISPSDPELFFANYTGMLIDLVNQIEGVEWMAIGTELTSLQLPIFDQYWFRMIALLRATPGTPGLFYAVNWDPGESPPVSPWFSELDGLGIDAYFPARDLAATASVDEIAGALEGWLPRLTALRDALPGLPLFVSETGASSSDVEPPVLAQPWFSDPDAPVDLAIQARYAEAACRVYTTATMGDGEPVVSGIFWWRTSVRLLDHPETDTSHEFRGKPAAAAISSCFAAWPGAGT